MKKVDITGQQFGKLTAVVPTEKRSRRCVVWECRCDCGKVRFVKSTDLRSGKSQSCGCLRGEHSTKHGHAKGGKLSPTMSSWKGMINRCHNPNAGNWHKYGGRGITVCDRWHTFENFLADMGERPSADHSIDRIDNSKGYEPGNCRWATKSEQARNRKTTRWLTANGETRCMAEWAKVLGVSKACIHKRLRSGMSPEEALRAQQ